VTQQSLDGVNLKRRITIRLEEYIERESLRTDKNFRMVADEVGVDEKTVRNIFTRHIKQLARSWRFEAPQCLGIDEVYIAGVARCVLTDIEQHRLVNIMEKRDMLWIRRQLLQIKHPDRVKVVVMDMWRPYLSEVKQRFPQAIVVIDKYHILRMANDAIMTVRKKLRADNKCLNMPKPHLLRKRVHDLHVPQKKALNQRLAELPDLAVAHALKEEFFNIWNNQDRRQAEAQFDEWVKRIPPHLQFAYAALLTTVGNWREEILNYFDYRVTNAFTESLNNIIKSMERNGRGYTFDVLRAKLLYGSPFVTRRPPRPNTSAKEKPTDRRKKEKKRARRDDAPSPNSNVRQLKRVRLSEDEFTESMRPPEGYIKRFKNFRQLNFDF
jgi:transposase